MTTEAQKNRLLEDFRNYLEQSRNEESAAGEQPDLHTLLSEMAGLKAEVKAESRHFKSTLDTLSSALAAVQADNKTLSMELAVYAERLEQQQHETVRTMLLDILDIYERLHTGLDVLKNYRPVAAPFRHSRDKDVRFIKQFKEGQVMTIGRFEQILQRYQVRTIDCVGKLLDPATMRAVETGHDPQLDNGVVMEELRKGFLIKNQVLRPAEVKVNKTTAR